MEILIYDKKQNTITSVYVENIGDNKFRMNENDLANYQLSKGTEFETTLNNDGHHEVVKILKESDFVTRCFLLSRAYKISDYQFLLDELCSYGGYWQVDFGGIITINIPKDFHFDIDHIINEFQIDLIEISDT